MPPESLPVIKPVIVLVGPTAIGKTELSLSVADKFDCEIVSLDSMQVYRYMDIGTAKASREEREIIPHHLIDIVDPDEPYDANCFVIDALQAIRTIHDNNKIPLLTGGTGLYLRALTEGLFDDIGQFPLLRKELKERMSNEGVSKLHEELRAIDCISASRIHKNDTHRVIRALEIYHATGMSWSEHIDRQSQQNRNTRFQKILHIGLTCERETLYQRINKRTALMMDSGLKEEVEQLINDGFDRGLKSMQSIGYRHMVSHLFDGWNIEETEEKLARDTRRYAKRQYTWFKKMNIEWFETTAHKEIIDRFNIFLK